MIWENDTFALVKRMRAMVYSSKDFESLWFLRSVGSKNSLGFGSHAGVEISVIYHTFIETCKMCSVSTLDYFKVFFKAAIKRAQCYACISFAERE